MNDKILGALIGYGLGILLISIEFLIIFILTKKGKGNR